MERNRDVKGLIKALRHKDLDVRSEAAKALVRIGEPAVEQLVQALGYGDSDLRSVTVRVLGEIGGARALEPLTYALKDENVNVRIYATEALGKVGDARSVEPLIQAFVKKDEYLDVRKYAAEALVSIGQPAVDPLIQALKDEKASVRVLTAVDLGRIGDSKGVDPLIQALQDKDWQVRKEAAWALGNIGDPRAVEPLTCALKDARSLMDQDKEVRLEASNALIKIGVKVGRPAVSLIQAFKYGQSDKVLKYGFSDLRKKAEAILEESGWVPQDDTEKAYFLIAKKAWKLLVELGEPAVEPLVQALKYEDLRTEAIRVLGEIGHAKAIETLIQLLSNQDPYTHSEAVRALVRIGEPAVEHLIQALRDMDLREGAIGVLEEIGSARAVEPLIRILKDNGKARSKAADALGKIGDVRAVEPLIEALSIGYIFDSSVQVHAAGALGKIRDSRAVDPLIHALKDKDTHVQDKAAEVLGKMGDLRAAEAIIDWLFRRNLQITSLKELNPWIETMGNLFSNYTDVILKATVYIDKVRWGDEVIHKLCNIHTQISNNILHKLSQKEDTQVVVGWHEDDWGNITEIYETWSFEFQRETAKTELKRRGNPHYDPSAYLNKEAWKA